MCNNECANEHNSNILDRIYKTEPCKAWDWMPIENNITEKDEKNNSKNNKKAKVIDHKRG